MSWHEQVIEPPGVVCVRAPNWVGDVVMATPVFRCLRIGFPQAHILLVIRDKVADVLRGATWFDERVLFRGGPRDYLRCASEIRRRRCELGLVLPHSFSSALMLWLGCVRRRVGYVRDMRRMLLTDPVPRPSTDGRFRPTYMVDYYLALCGAVGLRSQGRDTELPYAEQDIGAAEALLAKAGVRSDRPLFLFHPSAGYGPSKLWPADRFGALAGLLQREFGAQVACVGAPEAAETVRRIRAACDVPVVDLTDCGVDLHLLKCIVRLSGLLVTTDSGPRHYGVALGVPTVCLMGPTHPGYSTSGRPHDHVVRVAVGCGPCQRKVCRLNHRCMDAITPEMALAACRRALRS